MLFGFVIAATCCSDAKLIGEIIYSRLPTVFIVRAEGENNCQKKTAINGMKNVVHLM
jgi:hypothetical protein